MQNSGKAPGFQRRYNKDGTSRAYWHATAEIKKLGYQPTQVRLDDRLPPEQWPAECRYLHSVMLKWALEQRENCRYDGTFLSLWKWYLSAEDSQFRDLRPSTQQSYKAHIKPLLQAKGHLLIEDTCGADVRRWFKELRAAGWSVGTAYLAISVLKAVLGFGASNDKEECAKLRASLSATRFESPSARDSALTYEQLVAFRKAAIEAGRPSMALGLTLQFELGMRQKDVIGEWLVAPGADGIRDAKGRRWGGGLTGMMFDDAGNVRKRTTKTGSRVEHSIEDYPELAALVRPALERSRGGPLVINEVTRLPYVAATYRDYFRQIACKAGIPDDVWCMDARAGAVTEAYESEASTEEAMAFAGHTQAKTSRRYLRRVHKQSSRVAKLRVERRGE